MTHKIAIDGPAAAGKGTIAKALAQKLGFSYLDTGLLYRAIAAAALKGEDPLSASRTLRWENIDEQALRTPAIADKAAEVAQIVELRQNLVAFQRNFAEQTPGTVLDGRDIGTVILPDAHVKIFVTATAHIRAERRLSELRAQGDKTSDLATILATIEQRDTRDKTRTHAPLEIAKDAHILDTSALSVAESFKAALEIVTLRLAI